MVWYKQLSFDENPLDVRPNSNVVNLEGQEDQLINHIQKQEICFLNGPTGAGKTSLLLRVQEKLKNHTFIYLDADDLPEDFDIEEVLMGKRNFFDKIRFKKYPSKKPVILIDEFQATDPNLILKLRSKWENSSDRVVKSVVIAQIEKRLRNVSGSFKERLGKKIINLNTLDRAGLKDMLKMRLYNKKTKQNYCDRFNDEVLNLLITCADNNPRRVLEYTDMIFDFHFRKFKQLNPILKGKDYLLSPYAVRDILKANNIDVDNLTKKKSPTKNIPFKKRFSVQEKKVLKLLYNRDLCTSDEIIKKLRYSPKRVKWILKCLKDKNAINITGRKGRYKLWEVAPGVKRVLVRK